LFRHSGYTQDSVTILNVSIQSGLKTHTATNLFVCNEYYLISSFNNEPEKGTVAATCQHCDNTNKVE